MTPALLLRLARNRRVRRLLVTLALINAAALLFVPVAVLGLAGAPVIVPAGSCAPTAVDDAAAGQAKPANLTATQQANAQTIITVGRTMHVPTVGLVDAISTALTESGLNNLAGGDADSAGLFQQRPSQGWGTYEQVTDPAYSAGRFYRALLAVPGWETMPPGVADQAVQGSAFPDRYALFWGQAQTIVSKAGGPITPTKCGPSSASSGKVTAQPPPNVTNAVIGEPWPVGMCQDFVRSKLGAPFGAPTAIAAWGEAQLKHPGDPAPPAMVPVYFRGGSTGAGHAALSAGNGWIFSTDWPAAGRVGEVRITKLAATWHEEYLGWTGDINGKVVHR